MSNNSNNNINNLGNKGLNGNNQNNFGLNNNNEMRNTTLVVLVIGGIVLLIFAIIMISIYIKTHRQNKIQNHAEEELLSHTHDVKDNPIDIAGSKIPSSTIGNEYSLNFWLYINSLEYRGHHNKQILMKGDPGFYNKSLQAYTKSNPAIYIAENSNTMKILFEKSSGGESVENKGCFRKFDIDTDNEFNISASIDNVLHHINDNQNEGIVELVSESEESNHNFTIKRIEGAKDSYYIMNGNRFLKSDGSNLTFANPSGESISQPTDGTEQPTEGTEPLTEGTEQPTEGTDLIYPDESNKDDFTFIITEVLDNDKVLFTIKPKKLSDENKDKFLSYIKEVSIDTRQLAQIAKPSGNSETPTEPQEPETETEGKAEKIKVVLGVEDNLFTIRPVNNLFGYDSGKRTIDSCRTEAKESSDNSYFGMHLQNEEIKDGLLGTIKPSELDSGYCYIDEEYLGEDKLIDSYSIDDNLCKIHPETNETFGSNSHMYVHGVDAGSTFEIFEIKNIPIQRWVCINLTVRDHVVDVFLDGLLHKTFTLTGGSPMSNNFPIILGNNGGIDGYLSRITWSNKALTPGQIYNKYKQSPRVTKGVWDRIKGMFGGKKDTLEGKPRED